MQVYRLTAVGLSNVKLISLKVILRGARSIFNPRSENTAYVRILGFECRNWLQEVVSPGWACFSRGSVRWWFLELGLQADGERKIALKLP